MHLTNLLLQKTQKSTEFTEVKIKEESLNLRDGLLDLLGLQEKKKTIYTLSQPKQIQTVKLNPFSLYDEIISLDSAKKDHIRNVYTYFDLFGDIGGLQSLLIPLI